MRPRTAVRTHRYGKGIDVPGAYEAMNTYLSLQRTMHIVLLILP